MRVVICESEQDTINFCAQYYRELLNKKPDAVLGLATGGTPVNLYNRLVQLYQAGEISFARVKSFNLDEYWQLPATHQQSYRYFMQRNLFDRVDIQLGNTHLPDGMAEVAELACDKYEKLIASCGGIDLQLLGIGRNGHIGFNEPTSSLCSRTRVKTLDPKTMQDNARFFTANEYQPSLALTMGIGTILDAREVLLLATGDNKANAIQATIEGPLSAMCPASALQQHNKVTVVVDAEAASKLELKEYYLSIEAERQKLTGTAR
jgi:glucosamine-6-phosphate deaminase